MAPELRRETTLYGAAERAWENARLVVLIGGMADNALEMARQTELVRYLAERELIEDARFWKLAQALFAILPRGGGDWKVVNALLGVRETLKGEARPSGVQTAQRELGFVRERA